MPGFLVSPEDVDEDRLYLRGDEAHHLLRVWRRRVGDQFDVIDGHGGSYAVRLDGIEAGTAGCAIVERRSRSEAGRVTLQLAPALIKGQRFDYVLEKAVELGVAAIHPLLTERGVAKASSNARRERWTRVGRAAAKQSGRSILPEVASPGRFDKVVTELAAGADLLLMAVASDGEDLAACLEGSRARKLGLLVGPEGGFSPAEVDFARSSGVRTFTWGDATLRADTASVALAAVVLHEATRHL